MADAREIELLVEAIAERVRGRLGDQGIALPNSGGSQLAGYPSACHSCEMPAEACAMCGIHPANQPHPDALRPVGDLGPKEIARVIDHTLLKPDTARDQIETICREARQHSFFSVCVNASMVRLASSMLHGSSVKVCAVVGFPLGAGTPGAKAYEAREAVRCGASEIDMVLNIGALKSRDYGLVQRDIEMVVKAVAPRVVKVILETGMLTDEEKAIACALAKSAKAAFVKTSTGFGPGGATIEDIELMRRVVGPDTGVKASGGVRDYATALAMLRAGASRLGCSSSVAVVTGGRGTGGY